MAKVSENIMYGSLAKDVMNMYTNIVKSAVDSIVIAKFIKKGIETQNPKTRYVGISGAKMMLFFRKILSDKMFDKMVMNRIK